MSFEEHKSRARSLCGSLDNVVGCNGWRSTTTITINESFPVSFPVRSRIPDAFWPGTSLALAAFGVGTASGSFSFVFPSFFTSLSILVIMTRRDEENYKDNVETAFQIYLRGARNKTYTMSVTPATRLVEVKTRFQKIDGFPPDKQILTCSGRSLFGDSNTMSGLGINKEDVIRCRVGGRGGMPTKTRAKRERVASGNESEEEDYFAATGHESEDEAYEPRGKKNGRRAASVASTNTDNEIWDDVGLENGVCNDAKTSAKVLKNVTKIYHNGVNDVNALVEKIIEHHHRANVTYIDKLRSLKGRQLLQDLARLMIDARRLALLHCSDVFEGAKHHSLFAEDGPDAALIHHPIFALIWAPSSNVNWMEQRT
jgi:hypothetical protein